MLLPLSYKAHYTYSASSFRIFSAVSDVFVEAFLPYFLLGDTLFQLYSYCLFSQSTLHHHYLLLLLQLLLIRLQLLLSTLTTSTTATFVDANHVRESSGCHCHQRSSHPRCESLVRSGFFLSSAQVFHIMNTGTWRQLHLFLLRSNRTSFVSHIIFCHS